MQELLRLILSKGAYVVLFVAGALFVQNVGAEKIWNWTYRGGSIVASGTFTTSENADSLGFYQIFGIAGHRNGDPIKKLHPTGSAIPGNEPHTLDNLIRIDTKGQITVHGFGFSTASGNYVNAFFSDSVAKPGYMEVFTTVSTFSELPVTFLATPVTEPEINVEPTAEESKDRD
ncbi:MAG: hypothetical protein ABL861_10690 [Nitrosomonas sp.]